MAMPPEVDAVYCSPNSAITGSAAAMRLRLSLQGGPICLIPRTLPRSVASILHTAASDAIPTFKVTAPLFRARTEVGAAFEKESCLGTTATWLRDDVLALVDLYAEAFNAAWLQISLTHVDRTGQRAFGVDPSAFRLVTSYIGPGPEWISPRWIAKAWENQRIDTNAIRHVDCGTIAVLRGGKATKPDRPAILHRSPSPTLTRSQGLLLSIREGADDQEIAVADRIGS